MFGGGKPKARPEIVEQAKPTEDKAAMAQAEALARRRAARGYRSTIVSDMSQPGKVKLGA